MLHRAARVVALAVVVSATATLSVRAESCRHHDHTTGTVVGAVGGGVVGSAVTHGSLGGVVVGAVVGGLAGNAISRDMDCHHAGGHDADLDDEGAAVDDVKFHVYGGRHYCWYGDAWNGPGYYWCGYGWHRGYGWGGPYGWNDWHGDNGWHGHHGDRAWIHGHTRYAQGGEDEGHGEHGREHGDHD